MCARAHNNRYIIDWSPAIMIEKDIQIFLASLDLNFILKNIVYDVKFLNLLKHTQKQYGFGFVKRLEYFISNDVNSKKLIKKYFEFLN